MHDLTVVPWSIVWFGLVLAVCGAILGFHGIGQRRPSRVAGVGGAAMILGASLMVVPPLVNGVVMIARAFGAAVHEAVASTYPQDAEGAPR